MNIRPKLFLWYVAFMILIPVRGADPVPDKLVVLTFDDSVASQFHVVRPILREYGFSATFFISEGFSFKTNKTDYMTWEQIAQLNRDGFEIGNHTRDHMGVNPDSVPRLPEQLEAIANQCVAHGIPTPTSFAYPGNVITPEAFPVLEEHGIRLARRGGAPEHPYEEGRGFAYEPAKDHPLLIPSAGDARPSWTLENFKRAARQARDGRIAVLQFHGAQDNEHPWVNTPSERFREYMQYLHQEGYRVVALRDIARHVDPAARNQDPWEIIHERKAAAAQPK